MIPISSVAVKAILQRHDLLLQQLPDGSQTIVMKRSLSAFVLYLTCLAVLLVGVYLTTIYIDVLGTVLRRIIWLTLIIPVAYITGNLYQQVRVNFGNTLLVNIAPGRFRFQLDGPAYELAAIDIYKLDYSIKPSGENSWIATLRLHVSQDENFYLLSFIHDNVQELERDICRTLQYIEAVVFTTEELN